MAAPLVAIAVVFVGSFADVRFFDNALPAYLIALGIAVWFGMRPNRREAIAGWAALQIVSVVITYRDPQTESAERLLLVAGHLHDRLDHRLRARRDGFARPT